MSYNSSLLLGVKSQSIQIHQLPVTCTRAQLKLHFCSVIYTSPSLLFFTGLTDLLSLNHPSHAKSGMDAHVLFRKVGRYARTQVHVHLLMQYCDKI